MSCVREFAAHTNYEIQFYEHLDSTSKQPKGDPTPHVNYAEIPTRLRSSTKFLDQLSPNDKRAILACCDRVYLNHTHAEKAGLANALIEHHLGRLSQISATDLNRMTVIFSSTPHFPWDLTLFFCLKTKGVRTIILRRAPIQDTLLFANDFRTIGGDNIILNLQRPENERSVLKRANEVPQSTIISRAINVEYDRTISAAVGALRFFAYAVYTLVLPSSYFLKIDSYFQLSRIKTLLLMKRRFHSRKKSQTLYKALVLESLSKPQKPYAVNIVCPLHFRPERSTIPELYEFKDQFEIIDRIRSALDGIPHVIYVKEHPRQLSDYFPDIRRINFDEHQLYNRLSSIDCVRFLDPKIDHIRLAQSKPNTILAGCTGTSLWESCMAGVPAISFARTWHDRCEITPFVGDKSESELKHTIMKLANSSNADNTRHRNFFLNTVENFVVHAPYNQNSANLSAMTSQKARAHFVAGLIAVLRTKPVGNKKVDE